MEKKKASDFRYNTGETKVPWAAVGENYNAEDLMTIIRFMMKGKGADYEKAIAAVEKDVYALDKVAVPPAKLSLDVEVAKAENMCDEYLHTKGSTFLTNCTAGFEIACKYTGLKPGDEVIVPAITFAATMAYPLSIGCKLVFADVDPITLNMDPKDVAKKITDKTTNTEWFQKGSEILTKIIDGIKSLFSNLGQAASDLVSQVWDTITNTNWLDLGRNIIEGIANGVSNAVSTLVQAAKNVANSALNAIKSALGISSPSKVFAKEVGRWIPPGIGKGVDQAMPELTDDMRAQLQDLIDDANVSVATEVGGLSSKLALTANSGSGGGNHSQTITNDNGIIVYVTYNGDGSEEDARRVGKQIGAETAREIRRRGLAPT